MEEAPSEWQRQMGTDLPVFKGVFSFQQNFVKNLLQAVIPRLQKDQRGLVLGSGSGFDAAVAAKTVGVSVLATDIDPLAVANTKALALLSGANVTAFQSDLFENIEQGDGFDFILFDAPLAHTADFYEKYGRSRRDYYAALARLRTNRKLYDPEGEILKNLLANFPRFLRPGGRLYLMSHEDISSFLPVGTQSETLLKFQDEFYVRYAIHAIRAE